MTPNKTIKGLFILFLICSLTMAVACNGSGNGGGDDFVPRVLPQEEAFEQSGHADASAEAFNHWDEDGVIPEACAKCHNTTGFLDFLGIADSTVRVVDNPVVIDPDADNSLECETCHNDETFRWDTVIFPSGVAVDGTLGRWSFCMECHQGRESTVSVNAAIAAAAPLTPDTVDPDLEFINSHYFVAAATQYGSVVMGGYQYDGRAYDGKFQHVEGIDTCIDCHDPHSTDVQIQLCQQCHTGVQDVEDLEDIRMFGSLEDYDGDGNTTEGIAFEITTLQEKLNDAIQAYASEVVGTCIVYDQNVFPYFFIDTNCNGTVDPGENIFPNQYTTWTERLVKATYNLQFTIKDPGAFAHNAKYAIQLLFDSIEDLNSALSPGNQIDMSGATRNDAGHFDGTAEPFRHWDVEGEVPPPCSKCHSSQGLPLFLATGEIVPQPPTNGFLCSVCHPDLTNFSVQRAAPEVVFPSGAVIDSGNNTTNLCMTCHQGITSKFTVDTAVAGLPENVVDTSLSFINIHYFAAGATRFGTEVKGGYEYFGRTYVGYFPHVPGVDGCSDCHDTHLLEPRFELCGQCHLEVQNLEDIADIRLPRPSPDFNGNGNVNEGISFEISGLRDILYNAIRLYAATNPGTNRIVYEGNTYPYFFTDTNGNGLVDEGEATFANRYSTWTPRLLKAAYNLQYTTKDPGCSAHNADYAMQLLYDSIADLGTVNVGNLVRPVTGT